MTATFTEPGAGVDTTGSGVPAGSLTATPLVGAPTTVASTSCTPTSCTFDLPTSAATAGAEGALSFSLTIADRMGNVSTTKTGSRLIDDKAPTLTSITAPGAWFGPGNSVPVNAVLADGGASFAPGAVKLRVGTQTFPGSAGAGGSVDFSLPANALVADGSANGALAFTLEATDAAGNAASGLTNANALLKVDRKPPVPSPSADLAWHRATDTVSITGTAVESDSGLGGGLASVTVNPGAALSTTGQASGTFVGSAFSVPFPLAGLGLSGAEGPQSLFLATTDAAGNTGGAVVAVNVDEKGPSLDSIALVSVNPDANSGGYYGRWPEPKLPVTVTATDGTAAIPGSGVVSATLSLNGTKVPSATGPTGSGATRTFTFNLNRTLAPAGIEGDVTITASATDLVGNTSASGAPATATFRLDSLGPTISNVIVNGRDATVSGVPFFKQLDDSRADTLADIDVQATIIDLGSGVMTAPTLAVLPDLRRLDSGTAVKEAAPSNVWHFKIKRANSQVIGTGSQATLDFKVVAYDNQWNPQQPDAADHISVATLGIDGQLPTVSFSPGGQYPPAGAGCDWSGTLLCGHDGNRFWRQGDDGRILAFSADDGFGGSGVSPAASSGSCAVPGQAVCTATYTAANGFQFAINPSQAAFVSDWNGEGTLSVSVTAKDAVGNVSAPVTAPVVITRLKWVRTLAGLSNVRGAPVVTPPIGGAAAILVGGTANLNLDPIYQLGTNGAVVGSIGKSASGAVTISANLAYSPTSNLLYAVTSLLTVDSFGSAPRPRPRPPARSSTSSRPCRSRSPRPRPRAARTPTRPTTSPRRRPPPRRLPPRRPLRRRRRPRRPRRRPPPRSRRRRPARARRSP